MRKNCVFVDTLFQERIDTFPLKKSKSKKKIFYIGKKYFSFSKSVSQLVFWNFNGDGDSNLFPGEIRKQGKILLKSEKNISEFQSVDRSTPDSDFLEELPKSGENLVLSYCGGRSFF